MRTSRIGRRGGCPRGGAAAAPAAAPAPVQDPGGDQAPPGPAGPGRQGGARQQGRGAHHLSVARRPLLRADAQHRARRRHFAQDHRCRPTAAASRRWRATSRCRKAWGSSCAPPGAQRTKTEIKRDFDYLMRLWENVRDLTLQSIAPALVYEEGSLIKRSIRDLYTKDVDEVLVEGEDGLSRSQGLHEDADAEPCQEREALQGHPPAVLALPGGKPARRAVFADRDAALGRLSS